MARTPRVLEGNWQRIREHYAAMPRYGFFSRSYRNQVCRYFRHSLPAKGSVLEVGCATGYLLEQLGMRDVYGIDLVESNVTLARERIGTERIDLGAGETFEFSRTYDAILLSDLLNEAADVQMLLENLKSASHRETRLFINFHNTLWRPILAFARFVGLKPKRPEQNWLSRADVRNLLGLAGWEIVRLEPRILIPLGGFFHVINRWLAPFVPWLCLSIFITARPLSVRPSDPESVSVLIPARNEAGNIEAAVRRTPAMGKWTELVFVEGNSSDGTWEKIQQVQSAFPERRIRAFQQTGKGKGDAMRLAYEKAEGDILMILDADLTVPPEDLPKFYDAVHSGKADFANGVRLVYPMEAQAMRFLNMCGNKFFSLLFSWILDISIKDTLCGTKVLRKSDYQRLAANRSYFGEFDPFGDFDLIFGAVKLNLKVRDIPIRYHARNYGETQIHRWRDGWLLIRMAAFAARKLKFV